MGSMANLDESFASLTVRLVGYIDEISTYIQNSDYISEKYGKDVLHHSNCSTAFECLKDWSYTRYWDEYFSHIIELWDGRLISPISLNNLIQRLSAPAAQLDSLVPEFEKECRSFKKVPESVIRNAREMHTCVNSFLNSVDDALIDSGRYPTSRDIVDVRRRRPHTGQASASTRSESDTKAEGTKKPSKDDRSTQERTRHHRLKSMRDSFISNPALFALTSVISIISCTLQAGAYFTSSEDSKAGGIVKESDFYTALQTVLMQSLALYAALAPAWRSGGPRYQSWTWFLSILSLFLGAASIAVYFYSKALAPLLACISNVLVAFVILQLVFAVNDKDHHHKSLLKGSRDLDLPYYIVRGLTCIGITTAVCWTFGGVTEVLHKLFPFGVSFHTYAWILCCLDRYLWALAPKRSLAKLTVQTIQRYRYAAQHAIRVAQEYME